jgi:hypothetical protein
MKYGIELLVEQPGDGPAVERHESYRIRVKMWLNRGDLVRWEHPWGLVTHAYLEDDGATLVTDVRMDRVSLIPGLFLRDGRDANWWHTKAPHSSLVRFW